MKPAPLALVIGALNIDLIARGLPKFAPPGQQVNGETLDLTAGGKGRNIAEMLAAWLAPGQVGMISKLVRDSNGLYRIPLQSLAEAGINAEGVLLDTSRPDDLPTLALILNTLAGERSVYYFPGRNESLTPKELADVRPLFEGAAQQDGFLLLSLEMPLETAVFALAMAHELGLRVMLDPGGQPPEKVVDFSPLFQHPIFLLKPNAEEATRLTGLPVGDYSSAQRAAEKLLAQNVSHLLITHGALGAYAFSSEGGWHIPAPDLPAPPEAEATGCGDQVLAVLCAALLHGQEFESACRTAVQAGSLQYVQPGRAPIPPDHPGLSEG